jgi:hypothetical protein
LLPSLFPDENYNRFMGQVRLKTIQVKDNSCASRISLQDHIPFCYTDELRISTAPYGTSKQWQYKDDSEESAFRSQFSNRNYPAGGFIVDLDLNSFNETLPVVQSFRAGNWIDLNTRAVVASLTVFNVNLNKIATLRVLFEFGLSGDVQASAQVYQLNASFYTTTQGHGLLTIELLCLFYIVLEFIVREIYEVKKTCFFLVDMRKDCSTSQKRIVV